jgi:hypothetical protein
MEINGQPVSSDFFNTHACKRQPRITSGSFAIRERKAAIELPQRHPALDLILRLRPRRT